MNKTSKKSTKKIRANSQIIDTNKVMRDDDNPDFAFQTLSVRLLVDFNNPRIDIRYYVRKELASRGLDNSGIWIGFEAAKKLHRIS